MAVKKVIYKKLTGLVIAIQKQIPIAISFGIAGVLLLSESCDFQTAAIGGIGINALLAFITNYAKHNKGISIPTIAELLKLVEKK